MGTSEDLRGADGHLEGSRGPEEITSRLDAARENDVSSFGKLALVI